MRISQRLIQSLAKWSLAIGCVAAGTLATEPKAQAHFPFHYRSCLGGYGYGVQYYGGYSGGYSSFYSYRSPFCYSPLSYCHAPRYYSVSYYAPTYVAPVYYAPTYFAPTYCPPICAPSVWCDPCTTWGDTNFSVGFQSASTYSTTRGPSDYFASSKPNFTPSPYKSLIAQSSSTSSTSFSPSSPLMSPSSRFTSAVVAQASFQQGLNAESPSRTEPMRLDSGIELVSKKPVLLQPYSPIWTKAAVGIVDDMIAAGELDNAHTSCKSMERINQPKGAGVYLRQALLSYFSDAATSESPEDVLRLLELACEAGSQVDPSELSKGSLNQYFAACAVDVDGAMEKLSMAVLESPNRSSRELLLLAALLKLDGQSDRAKLFAAEVHDQVATSNGFRWNRLLEVCLN